MNVRKLNPKLRKAIERAFNTCGKMQLYDYDAVSMVKVIAQTLEQQNELLTKLKMKIHKANDLLSIVD